MDSPNENKNVGQKQFNHGGYGKRGAGDRTPNQPAAISQ
jgi:hypothetical protein